ncbi:MAG: bifunctional alpha/beta hydrolase/OsmC family protein [Planctomycetota bacterium]
MSERTIAIRFPNAAGQKLAARLELPAGTPAGWALFAHCFTCSKDIAAASRISRALRGRGIAVLRFDFTGLGSSEGDFANTNFSSNVADLVAAADHLRAEYHAPQLLVGHSLGGAAVLVAGARIPEVRAVATIAAPSSPKHVRDLIAGDVGAIERDGEAPVVLAGREFRIQRQFLLDLDEQNIEKEIAALARPLLFFHAPGDEVVPFEHARRLFDLAPQPRSLVSLDGADHLLSRREDSRQVAAVLAAWASRYFEAAPLPAEQPEGLVRVEESGGRFTQHIRAGRHTLTADEPLKVGGDDRGPSPYDLLLAALGACTSMTLRMYAEHKKLPLDHVAVELRHAKIHAEDCRDCETRTGKVDRIERAIAIQGALTAEQKARMIEIADRCPVHRSLEGEIEILTRSAEA